MVSNRKSSKPKNYTLTVTKWKFTDKSDHFLNNFEHSIYSEQISASYYKGLSGDDHMNVCF